MLHGTRINVVFVVVGAINEDKDDNGIIDCTGECPRYMCKTVAGVCGCNMPNTDSNTTRCWTTTSNGCQMAWPRNLPERRSNKNECKIKKKPCEHEKNGSKCN